MKIALITNNYLPFVAGVPISVNRLAVGLRELGHTVYVFAPDYKNNGCDDEYTFRFPTMRSKIKNTIPIPIHAYSEITRKFDIADIDIIHVHHPVLIGYTALHLAQKYHKPLVFTYHTRYEQYLHYLELYRSINKRAERGHRLEKAITNCLQQQLLPGYLGGYMKRCDMVFAPTESIRENLLPYNLNIPIRVIPTGLPESAFSMCKSSADIRRKFLNEKKYLFCTVSRLSKEKNLAFMLYGLALAKAQIGDCFNTIIIGDGPEKESLKHLATDLGLENSVFFLGTIPNDQIVMYHGACDLFLFSSLTETQGIVLLEAMAASLPVLGVKATGVSDVVKNGENGFLTENDVEDWATKLILLLKKENRLADMRCGAKKTALQYTQKKIAAKAAECYQEIIIKSLRISTKRNITLNRGVFS